jgi:hypothetical protein
VVVPGILVYACNGDNGNNDVCTPACGAGTICKAGRCVTNPNGADAGDGGEIIIPGNPDTGLSNKKDGGPHVTGDTGPDTCGGESTKAQQLPLDMYIMLDKSGSMACSTSNPNCTSPDSDNKWKAVTAALQSFLSQNVNSPGMSVGIQFFAILQNPQCVAYETTACTRNKDCGSCGPCVQDSQGNIFCEAAYTDSCDSSTYSTPAQPIQPLTQAQVNAIDTSIASVNPNGATPTAPALQGAIQYAQTYASTHPQHVGIVVFATDGEPTECAGVSSRGKVDQATFNAIAAAGYNGNPRILTFVIGILDDGGGNLPTLNGIAQSGSGNTNNAFLVGGTTDVNTAFLQALNSIRGAVLGCNYTIPTPSQGTRDLSKVNVNYVNGTTKQTSNFINVPNQAACATAAKDAWYFDVAPPNSTEIILCPSTCTKVEADTKGEVDVVLGCTTIIN